jgi:hypothetical protein
MNKSKSCWSANRRPTRERSGDAAGEMSDEIRKLFELASDDIHGGTMTVDALEHWFGPLLRAGQAMRDEYEIELAIGDPTLQAWDEAIRAALQEEGKGTR